MFLDVHPWYDHPSNIKDITATCHYNAPLLTKYVETYTLVLTKIIYSCNWLKKLHTLSACSLITSFNAMKILGNCPR